MIVQVEITPKCDNNCGFCYNFWKNEASTKMIFDRERITQLFDTLIKHEVPAICFTGGEPLLEKQVVYRFLNKSKKLRMYTSLNTNGRLITPETAEKLKTLGLTSALVSIHGSNPRNHDTLVGATGAFTEMLDGFTNLVSQGVNVTANYVVSKRNIKDIVKTADVLKNIGIKRITLTPFLPYRGVKDHLAWAIDKKQFSYYFKALGAIRDRGVKIDSTLPIPPCILVDIFPDSYLDYLKVLSPRVCMAGVTFMVISPEGKNRACIQAPELNDYGGNILHDFKKAWSKSRNWSDRNLIPNECRKNCHALPICGGGCRTSSLAINNSVNGKTMYMGQPLSKEDAEPFIKRIEVEQYALQLPILYRKNSVFFREETFGALLANTSNQSFILLTQRGADAYHSLPTQFRYDRGNPYTDRFIRVLWAARVITQSSIGSKHALFKYELDNDGIIHPSKLFHRLGKNLPLDQRVRCLRGDTGERIFF
ncbi:MAG: radical SAM protein [Candidatus Bathyarchaeota archaeon]|nr:MAG: radical SAM protein [Candidatus Bathyarchaeota archaeon]